MRLQKLNFVSNIHIGPFTNLVIKQGHRRNNYQFYRAPNNSPFCCGRGRGSQNKSVCQLCGKDGNISLKCYYCLDISFIGPQGQPRYENFAPFQGTHLQDNAQAYFAMLAIVNDPN